MFGNYVYEKASARYVDKILLIDDDNLDETTNYSADFLAQGFEVVKYTDDLSFRIKYGEKLNSNGDKIVVVANSDNYIPYDIRHRFRTTTISLSSLFPMLNIDVLREKPAHDLGLLCLAYKSNYDNLRQRRQTEDFYKSKVYTKSNVNNYLMQNLQKTMELMKDTSHSKDCFLVDGKIDDKEYLAVAEERIEYKDWFFIAEQKAKIDVLAAKYDIGIDTFEINGRFEDYVMAQYGQLSQIMDKDTPVLISRALEYIHEVSSKFVIIVMDGMSEFDWNIISTSFGDILYEKASAFAMIPTTTSVSRQCLLSNKFPSQLLEPWKQSKEKAEFIVCAKELGYTGDQIGYDRGYDVEFSSFVRCGAVIINDVDDIVHSQQQGRIGMFNDITVLTNQSKLAAMTKRFLTAGYDIYITSDHGNTPCIGLGKLMGTGVEVETKSRRMLVLKDFADKETLLKKYGLIQYPKYYLTKDYDYLICDAGDSFDAKGEAVMTHGGITLDEVIVPFIKIKAVKNNG